MSRMKIPCPYCLKEQGESKPFWAITASHLGKKHRKTLGDLRQDYPDCYTKNFGTIDTMLPMVSANSISIKKRYS